MLNIALRAAIAGALFHAASPLSAQAAPTPPSIPIGTDLAPVAVPALPNTHNLPTLYPVELIVVNEVSSKLAKAGDPVKLQLARPLYVTSDLGLAEGTLVEGVVIHAAKGGMGGKSGELLIAAQRISLNNMIAIPLRSFRVAPARGTNNEGVAMGLMIAGGAVGGVASMFVTGGSARVPAGTRAFAMTRSAIDLPTALLVSLPLQPVKSIPAPVMPAITTKGE